MASAHPLLTATRWRGAEIGNIAAAELGGLAPGQARWQGPELLLNPRATNAMTLALHELATNAVKFGALSTEIGRVEVAWQPTGRRRLRAAWTESGGPPVAAAHPARLRRDAAREGHRPRARRRGAHRARREGVRATLVAGATALAGRAGADGGPRPAGDAASPAGASSGAPALADGRHQGPAHPDRRGRGAAGAGAGGRPHRGRRQGGRARPPTSKRRCAWRALPFDVAVLDANLNGVSVTPVAEALAARGVPFIFATGYGDAAPAPQGFDAPLIKKPYDVAQIAAALAEVTGRAAAAGSISAVNL